MHYEIVGALALEVGTPLTQICLYLPISQFGIEPVSCEWHLQLVVQLSIPGKEPSPDASLCDLQVQTYPLAIDENGTFVDKLLSGAAVRFIAA